MKKQIIAKSLLFLFSFIVYLCLYFTLVDLFYGTDKSILFGISAAFTIIISPRLKVIKTQSGDKIQITWIFQKKAKTF